jgi:hypothetical protein
VDSEEKFRLLWSEKEQVWVAVYRLALTVCTFLCSFGYEKSANNIGSFFIS